MWRAIIFEIRVTITKPHLLIHTAFLYKMTRNVFVKFSYEDKLSEEIAIDLRVDIDLTKNSNRTKLLNRLLRSNPNVTEVTLLF